MSWLSTSTFFHPHFHSEMQTPLIIIFYKFKYVINSIFSSVQNSTTDFWFITQIQSLFLIMLGFKLTEKIFSNFFFTEKINSLFFIFFYFCTPMFYYSFFTSYVSELFLFPLLCFFILEYLNFKNTKKINFFTFSIVSGVLISSKPFYLIIVIPFFFQIILHNFPLKKHFRLFFQFLLPVILIYFCSIYNFYLKYDSFTSPLVTTRLLFDYELTSKIIKILKGLFWGSHAFFSNFPLIAISLYGLFKFYKKNSVKFNYYEIFFSSLFILTFMFPTFFLIGDFFEDQLPGRTLLATLPFLLIGFYTFFEENKKNKWFFIFLIFLLFLQIILIINYHLADKIGSYIYSREYILPKFLILKSLGTVKNMTSESVIYIMRDFNLLKIFILSSIISLFFVAYQKYLIQKLELFLIIIFIGQIFITILNFKNAKPNIETLKREGFYTNKVIGSGPEIYFYDYFFDVVNTIKSRQVDDYDNKIDLAIDQYYKIISNQIIQNQPFFEKVQREKLENNTHWGKGKIY